MSVQKEPCKSPKNLGKPCMWRSHDYGVKDPYTEYCIWCQREVKKDSDNNVVEVVRP